MRGIYRQRAIGSDNLVSMFEDFHKVLIIATIFGGEKNETDTELGTNTKMAMRYL